jgi:hypothetical protein
MVEDLKGFGSVNNAKATVTLVVTAPHQFGELKPVRVSIQAIRF